MKHIFIINPNAGKGSAATELENKLKDSGFDWQVYRTTAPNDGFRFAKEYCENNDHPVRFYACGGDGTIHEIANAIYGFPHASMSCYPIGSGNDYVKYYGGRERFLDPIALCKAPEVPVDLIRVNDEYAINACHFGLDSCVAEIMNKVRHHKILGGKRAYPTGVIYAFVKGMRHYATLSADSETLIDGAFLLCTAANGICVGGSYYCAPRSSNDDGLLEVCLVRPISRLRFLRVINKYKAGKHLDDPSMQDMIIYRRAKTMEVKAEKEFTVSLDGELRKMKEATVEIVPSALRFGVPEVAENATNT